MTTSLVAVIATVLYLGLIVAGAFLPVPEERERHPSGACLWDEEP